MLTVRRKAAVVFDGLLILAAALAGCGSAAVVPAHRAPVTPAHPPACTPKPVPGMALAARTSVGTGALASQWTTAILTALDAPVNSADTASMLAWFAAEDAGHIAGQYTYGAGEDNPLNLAAVSGDTVGATGSEPSGAGPGHPGNLDFRTPAYGIAATAQVIETRYPAINAALTSGKGLIGNPAVSAELSEWSGGGYASLR
jgi:hypothetical protein